jgi:hypothetical protein
MRLRNSSSGELQAARADQKRRTAVRAGLRDADPERYDRRDPLAHLVPAAVIAQNPFAGLDSYLRRHVRKPSRITWPKWGRSRDPARRAAAVDKAAAAL